MVRLAREGVLSAEPGRGFRLAPMSAAEVREIGSILAVLEPLALDQSGEPRAEQLIGWRGGPAAGADPR